VFRIGHFRIEMVDPRFGKKEPFPEKSQKRLKGRHLTRGSRRYGNRTRAEGGTFLQRGGWCPQLN